MARAMVGSPFHGSYGACSRTRWTSEVSCSGQDFVSSKCRLSVKNLVSSSSSPAGIAARRSSSESTSTDDFQGRYSSSCFDLLCAQTCPVNRDTYVQSWLEESVHERGNFQKHTQCHTALAEERKHMSREERKHTFTFRENFIIDLIIVRNIQEAPFLQYVCDSKNRLGRSHRQKISKELLKNPDQWSESPIRESLTKVDPDGVILVQKMESGCPFDCCLADAFQAGNEETSEMACGLQGDGAETNVWGVLVQARGVHANACYLLETTRVSSSGGICTRYCLTRAKCSGPSHVYQLENAWLL